MFRTDDPERDYDQYERERQAQLDRLPVCCECQEPIQDDYFYNIDGEYYCEDCLKFLFRKENI